MYKDSKNRLEALRREHPELFQSRVFFVKVMQLLDTFTFKLTLRREVIALFSDVAKRKHPPLKATLSSHALDVSDPRNHSPQQLQQQLDEAEARHRAAASATTGGATAKGGEEEEEEGTSSDASSVTSNVSVTNVANATANANASGTAANAAALDAKQ